MKFQIKEIITRNFKLLYIPSLEDGENMNFEERLDFGFALLNGDPKAILVNLVLAYKFEDQELFNLNFDTIYQVDELQEFDNEGKLPVKKQFIAHMAAIAYSAARGILHVQLQNTAFSKLTLPLKNIAEQFPNEIAINVIEPSQEEGQ